MSKLNVTDMEVMVDIETLGTSPGSVVLSIGAVYFNPHADTGRLGPEFHTVINEASSVALGLTADDNTIKWWHRQSREARKLLDLARDPGESHEVVFAMRQFDKFLRAQPPAGGIWGNGSDFDNVLLAAVYKKLDLRWPYHKNRCYRTLKNVVDNDGIDFERVGTHHNALDDAKTQALHCCDLLKKIK